MNIMQKATKHGLSGLLLAVTVLGMAAPLAAMSTPIYADNSQQTGNTDDVNSKSALSKQTVFGIPKPDYNNYDMFNRGFKSEGTSDDLTDNPLKVGLTHNRQHEFGSYTFRRAIDMSRDFTFKGSLNIYQPGSTLGDSLGFILAPVEPDNIKNESTGGYLGIGKEPAKYGDKGFANAFFWGADLHYNPRAGHVIHDGNPDHEFDGNTEFGDPDIMDSYEYQGSNFVMFRRTDAAGKLANIRDYTPDNHPNIVQAVNLNTQGDNPVTLQWTPDAGAGKTGPVSGTLTATGWGETWSEHITVAHEMAFSAIAATGGDTSYMTLKPKDFTLTVGTAQVTFDGVPVSKADTDFKQPDFGTNPKTAVVGTHITVVGSQAGLEAAQKNPDFEPDYVYMAPKDTKSPQYSFIGDGQGYQIFTVKEDPSQTFDLKYNRKSLEHIDYQFANQPGVYFNKKDDSGDDGQTYTETTPAVSGFTPDRATVTGTYNGDHKDLVTYYPTPSLPLNAGAAGVINPTKPVTPTNGTTTKPSLNTSNGLSLDYVPDFNFGKHDIERGTKSYPADDLKTDQGDMPLFAQVTDVRAVPGNWTLDVKAGPMTNKATQSVLTGAYLTFGSSDVKTTSKDNDVSKVTSTFAGHQLYFDGTTEMNVASSTSPEQATWLTRFIKSDKADAVTLNVPGGTAQNGDYEAVLTWTLGSKPGENQH